jgi:Icc protein
MKPIKDGIDRRGFLKCMQWAGTGMLWRMAAGVPQSTPLHAADAGAAESFMFVQISDSHIGFNKPANPDVNATLQVAIDRINALDAQPDLILHTGDLTHLAKSAEFDTLDQLLRTLRRREIFYVPGEHDFTGDDGKLYLERFGKGTRGAGWQSFNHKGVHFVGLNNVVQLEGWGNLGAEQLEWLRKDLAPLSASTPIVIFAHIPLWTVYPNWNWGTRDSEAMLALLKRFGSVTVLNGHIHQVMQKVEGSVTFHTAMSTAFPQPAPGTAPAPGPMKVEADRLRQVLGIAQVSFKPGEHALAVVDTPLAATSVAFDQRCGGCHALDEPKVGPPLRHAYGRQAGADPKFAYSDALKKSGISWNDANLDKWLKDPEAFVPGSDMPARLDSAAERKAIIDYLRSLRAQ